MALISEPNLPEMEKRFKLNLSTEIAKEARTYFRFRDDPFSTSLIEYLQASLGLEGNYIESKKLFSYGTFCFKPGQITYTKYYFNSPPKKIRKLRTVGDYVVQYGSPRTGKVLKGGKVIFETQVGPESSLLDILIYMETPIGGSYDPKEIKRKVIKMIGSGDFKLENPFDELARDTTPVVLSLYQTAEVSFTEETKRSIKSIDGPNVSLVLEPETGYFNPFFRGEFDRITLPYLEAVNVHMRALRKSDQEKVLRAFNVAPDMVIENAGHRTIKNLSKLRAETKSCWNHLEELWKFENEYKNTLAAAVKHYGSVLSKKGLL